MEARPTMNSQGFSCALGCITLPLGCRETRIRLQLSVPDLDGGPISSRASGDLVVLRRSEETLTNITTVNLDPEPLRPSHYRDDAIRG